MPPGTVVLTIRKRFRVDGDRSGGSPLLSTSLVLPDEELDSHDSEAVAERMQRHVDLMLDAEDCPPGPTSVVDLSADTPNVTRQGFRPLTID